jgi:4-hydroxy-2-oxoheptanedioate aldolase
VLAQLLAIGGSPTQPIVRAPSSRPADLQPLVDTGATTFLVPMVESGEQAAAAVAAVRYPPRGTRGVATTRASRWGRIADYWQRADDEMCVVVQIESVAGLAAIEEIAAVDGVDALFVGPSDLAAALGHLGRPGHEDVQTAVQGAIGRSRAAGRPVGVFATDATAARRYRDAGATFLAAGVDTTILASATAALAASYGAAVRGAE